MALYGRQGARSPPRKRNPRKKAKWLSEEALERAVKRREAKGKGENERYTHFNQSFKEERGEIRKPSSVINTKKQRKTTDWERLEISSRKLEIPREHFIEDGLNKA